MLICCTSNANNTAHGRLSSDTIVYKRRQFCSFKHCYCSPCLAFCWIEWHFLICLVLLFVMKCFWINQSTKVQTTCCWCLKSLCILLNRHRNKDGHVWNRHLVARMEARCSPACVQVRHPSKNLPWSRCSPRYSLSSVTIGKRPRIYFSCFCCYFPSVSCPLLNKFKWKKFFLSGHQTRVLGPTSLSAELLWLCDYVTQYLKNNPNNFTIS